MAQNFALNQPIVVALVNQLATQLPGACATVNANVQDGYTISQPTAVHDHMPLLSTMAARGFPAVAIEDAGTDFVDDLVSSVGSVHKFSIVAFLSNPDPEGLAWQLRRYQQAIALAVQYDRTLGGVAWTTHLNGIDPGPMLGPGEKPNAAGDNTFISWFAFMVDMPRTEV